MSMRSLIGAWITVFLITVACGESPLSSPAVAPTKAPVTPPATQTPVRPTVTPLPTHTPVPPTAIPDKTPETSRQLNECGAVFHQAMEGRVTIDGNPAPDGTVVTAWIEGEGVVAEATVTKGMYRLEPQVGIYGKRVNYKIGSLDFPGSNTLYCAKTAFLNLDVGSPPVVITKEPNDPTPSVNTEGSWPTPKLEVSVVPATLKVGETATVTVRVTGEGGLPKFYLNLDSTFFKINTSTQSTWFWDLFKKGAD